MGINHTKQSALKRSISTSPLETPKRETIIRRLSLPSSPTSDQTNDLALRRISSAPLPAISFEVASVKGLFDLPAELREHIYRAYLDTYRRLFNYDRHGRRYFTPHDPTVPALSILGVGEEVRKEVLGLLYRESELYISVWPNQVGRKGGLDFVCLDFDGDENGAGKLGLFRRMRFTLADTLELRIERDEDSQPPVFEVSQLSIPFYGSHGRTGVSSDDVRNGEINEEILRKCQGYVDGIFPHIRMGLKLVATLTRHRAMPGFTPLLVKRFVILLLKLLLNLRSEDRGDWEDVVRCKAILRGEEGLGQEKVREARELLRIGGRRLVRKLYVKVDGRVGGWMESWDGSVRI